MFKKGDGTFNEMERERMAATSDSDFGSRVASSKAAMKSGNQMFGSKNGSNLSKLIENKPLIQQPTTE